MTTHQTLTEARNAAKAFAGARCIVEIEHATAGRCYLVAMMPMVLLAAQLKLKPMPEIKRLVAEHSTRTADEMKAAREQGLRDHVSCERCDAKIDGNTAYSQKERHRGSIVDAWYCGACAGLLRNIGMGEFDGLQERARMDRGGRAPYTKTDF